MISVSRLKRLLAVLTAVFALAAGVAVIRVLADTVIRSASGADPTSIFNDVTPVPADLLEAIEWLPDRERDGRPMEPTTRVLITDAYARALSALDRAGRGDADAPLADYLSGPALETALAAADDPNAVISATFHLRQRLRLDVYSDDGSVVAIGVPEVEVVRGIDGAAGRTINTTIESWRFTMLLEDGNWRIQQLQTIDVETPEIPGAPRDFTMSSSGANISTVGGPEHTWTDVDDEAVAADLDAAADLGFGVVRVFVAGPEAEEVAVDGLESFLDQAAERGLSVIPVLFEDSPSHHPTSWHDDLDYLETIVEPLADHDAIVAWDLKDQPDLDEELSGGSVNIDAWLTRVASALRDLDPDTPITVGWSNPSDATRVLDWVDVMSFHYADAPAELPAALDEAVANAAGRPVLLSGFSSPEYRGRLQGMAPSLQADEFADLVAALDRPDLAGSIVSLLRDPAEADDHGLVTGPASTSIGLLRHDGTARATVDVLRDGPAGVPQPTITERVRSQPLLLLGGLVLILFAGGALGARLRRRRYLRWEADMIEWLDAGMPPKRRGRLLRWRRVPVKPDTRRRRRPRLMWWRRKKPWEPPTGDPIDPIAYLAEQVLDAVDGDAPDVVVGDDDARELDRVDDPLAQPVYGPAFETPAPAVDDEARNQNGHEGNHHDDDDDDDDDGGVWSPPDDIADVDETAVAWVEGALTGMVRQTADEGALAWVDDEVGGGTAEDERARSDVLPVSASDPDSAGEPSSRRTVVRRLRPRRS